MTDLEKLKALLDDFGVEYSTEEKFKNRTFINCDWGDNNVGGYPGFYTRFEFDGLGKFESMGAWE